MVTSNELKQGDIIYVKLDPAKGYETKKNRPCLVVSNNYFNRHYNTVWTLPISLSKKYQKDERYKKSPMFINIKKRLTNDNDKKHKFVYGTAMLQHLRSIDPRERCKFGSIAKATEVLPQIRKCIQMSI